MTVLARLMSAAIALLPLGGAVVRAEPADMQPKAVVELFTSQGCSSCPAADALFVELARSPELITLTLPVTYWDYLGWKDTLGKDAFAKRQKHYAKARGDGQVYTPQAVINGASHVIGSDKAEIEGAADPSSGTGFVATVKLSEVAGNLRVHVTPFDEPGERTAGIWLLPTTRMVTVPIARGENQGKTVSYANVVRELTRIGDWNGKEAVLTIPLSATQAPEADSYVVIVQADQPGKYGMMPGPILAAARSAR